MTSEPKENRQDVDRVELTETTGNHQSDLNVSEVKGQEEVAFSQGCKKNELPVDRGWAWLVCFSGFISFFIIGASTQATVVLFVDILRKYEANYTKGSLIFMFSVMTVGIMSLFSANVILPRIGEKRMIFIAGICFAIVDFSYAFAPNIDVFIALATMKGTAVGCIFVPAISLIRHYFHRRRSLANTIANSGQSVAIIVIGPLVMAIRHQYGLSGVFIILSALDLHLLVAALLLRPVESYSSKPQLSPIVKKKKNKEEHVETNANGVKAPDESGEKLITTRDGKDNSNINLQRITKTEEDIDDVFNYETNLLEDTQIDKSEEENKQKQMRGTLYSSTVSLAVDPGAEIAKAAIEEQNTQGSKSSWRAKFNKSMFGLWAFRMAVLSSIPSSVNNYVRMYVPTIASSQGATLDQAALLLTIVGAVDLVCRNICGYIADTHVLKPSQIILISQIGFGIVCQFLRFFTTFPTLIIMAVLMGMFTGTRIAMMALLSLETVGLEKMPQGLSFIATVATFSSALMNPALGAIAEETGSFILVMHIAGALLVIGACMLLTMPLLKRHDKHRAQQNT